MLYEKENTSLNWSIFTPKSTPVKSSFFGGLQYFFSVITPIRMVPKLHLNTSVTILGKV